MTVVGNELEAKLSEQLQLLRVLCRSYDEGEEVVALSIATAIRLLVHDTMKSMSLLRRLGRKATTFVSTTARHPSEAVHLGLVRRINVGVADGTGGEARYWPLCDERYFPARHESRSVSFEEWWSTDIIFQCREDLLSRKDLVLAIANKDGGAHVDVEVEARYDRFRKTWSGGSTLVGAISGARRGYDNIPTFPAIRQIAHELQLSL